jgi:hypothetical protein
MAKQGQHHSHHICGRPQPVEGRPPRGRKAPPTGTTAVPLLLPTRNTDITQLTTVNWGATKEPPQPPSTPSALSRFEGEEGREARVPMPLLLAVPVTQPSSSLAVSPRRIS